MNCRERDLLLYDKGIYSAGARLQGRKMKEGGDYKNKPYAPIYAPQPYRPRVKINI
jgi:hypothetical protein